MNIEIRLEQESDYRIVEELTKEAFWNLYQPGGDEHYLLHQLRRSVDFIPELDYVALVDNIIVGHIAYSRSYVLDERNTQHETIIFGPISVLPQWQNQGVGSALIEHTRKIAHEKGYSAIIIFGYPDYYKRFGFKVAKEYGISDPDDKFPVAHLVLELYEGALKGISGKFFASEAFNVDAEAAEIFDQSFPQKEKLVLPSQELFIKTSTSFL
jgi:putative acetyltransferase